MAKAKVYIGNLAYGVTEEDLQDLAMRYAPESRATIIKDKMTGRSKGFGFVTLDTEEAAARFVAAFHEKDVFGRPLTVNIARPMAERPPRRETDHYGEASWSRDTVALETKQVATLEVPTDLLIISDRLTSDLVTHFAKHPELMRTMHHRLFEELIAECWVKFGYEVELTKQTRDGGIDVIAIRRAEASVRYLIQCKRLGAGKRVSIEPVRELLGVKQDLGGSKAIIATTVYFTSEAKELMDRHRWDLEGRDYDGVVEWLVQAGKSTDSRGW